MEGLESRLPDDISVDQFTDTVEGESSATFSDLGISTALKNGTLRNKTLAKPSEIFTQFVTAGYQNGVPRLYRVEFDIDWNSRSLVGPYKVLLYPTDPANYQIFRFGTQEAIVDFPTPESYAYQQAAILSPKAMADISALRYPSLDETVSLSRALIQVEKNTNPDEVGGDIRTISILPSGRAEEINTTGGALPEGGTSKEKNQQNKKPTARR